MVAYFSRLAQPDGLHAKSITNLKSLLTTLFSDAQAAGYIAGHPLRNRLARFPAAARTHQGPRINDAAPFEQVAKLINWLEAHQPAV